MQRSKEAVDNAEVDVIEEKALGDKDECEVYKREDERFETVHKLSQVKSGTDNLTLKGVSLL